MPGFASSLLGDLESGLAVAALMNGPDEHNATEVVARFVLDLHRGAAPDPPGDPEPPPPSPPAEPLAEYAAFYGRFRSYNPWLPGFRVEQRESGLTASLAWGDDKPLTQLGEAEFRVGEEEWSPERLRCASAYRRRFCVAPLRVRRPGHVAGAGRSDSDRAETGRCPLLRRREG